MNHFYGLNTVFVLCCIVTIVSKLVFGSFLWPSVTQKESLKIKPNHLTKLILWKHYHSHFVRGFESHFTLNCRKNGVKAIPGSIPAPKCVLTRKYTKKIVGKWGKPKKTQYSNRIWKNLLITRSSQPNPLSKLLFSYSAILCTAHCRLQLFFFFNN